MADIKTLLGDDYHEGMTVDEINAALASREFVDPATLPKMVEKSVFDKTASALAKANKELNDLKKSSMTDDEKVQAAIQAAELKGKEYTSQLNRLNVEKLFVANGLTESDYNGLIEDIVSDDSEKTMKLAGELVSLVKNQKSATEKALRAELMKGTPKPPAGQGGKSTAIDYSKEISDALARGDNAGAAALMRKQQEENHEKEINQYA